MFLTRFQMNPQRRETLRLLASPQRMHAAVLGLFPPGPESAAGERVLWRLDEPARHLRTLYIVSQDRPSMEGLQESSGWSQKPSWETADYQPFLGRLAAEQQWRFRLTANPTRAVRPADGGRGRVVPHRTAAYQQAWLVERSQGLGFVIAQGEVGSQVQVTRRAVDTFVKNDGGDRRRPTITRVQYDGLMTVADPDRLRKVLTGGIGRAKAYGCGLMTLAPVS